MKATHKVYFGDSRNMSCVEDKSVQLVVTSPPYWQLKDYGSPKQIGFDDTYENYINNLNLVWLECNRVLSDGCRMCVNIGDQFARSVYYGRYKVIPIRTEIIRFCETIGLDFMGSIVWQKVTTCNTSGGATIMGSYPFPRNGIVKINYEHILLFKKQGRPPEVDSATKNASVLSKEEWNTFFSGHWNFPGEKQVGHLAMFPQELPHRLIKMFTFVGETVLDPFLGSGTTALAAGKLDRSSVGYEISEEFRTVIENRVGVEGNLFMDQELTFDEDANELKKDALAGLPYLFKDHVRLDKKIDPRKLSFGSRISKDSSDLGRSEVLRVRDVVSPIELKLDNDLSVRLLGVKPVEGRDEEAKIFLASKVRGKRVYLKYDDIKHDDANRLLVYMYLSNRTFVNAHLLKFGIAEFDNSFQPANKTLLKYSGGTNA